MGEFKDLARRQLDQKLEPLRRLEWREPPRGGWTKSIRQALGMSAAALGHRLGVTQSAISQLEASEEAETITLASLRRLGEGLQCRLVYALVPESTLNQILQEQAQIKARSIVDSVSTTMDLEDQSIRPEDRQFQIDSLAKSLLTGPATGLWDA